MRIEGVEDASETEQAKALSQWVRLFNRMATGVMIQAFDGGHGAESCVLDIPKSLFAYGRGYCGPQPSPLLDVERGRVRFDESSRRRISSR